jgi:hypothetical protein
MKKVLIGLAGLAMATCVCAQQFDDAAQRLAAQRAAMQRLSMLDGVWRGPATTTLPDGKKFELTQTERVGPFLDGAVKVIEGRGYDASGKVVFNAFGTVAFDPASKNYTLHSHAQGYYGSHAMKATGDGFVWEMPAGPTTIRFTITVKDGVWTEVGDRLMPNGQSVRFFEMKLQRVGDTTWPAGGAVSPK